jgi:hypothetical protein
MLDMGVPSEEEATTEVESEEPLDEFGSAIREAFPDNDWTPDRVAAMKEAIKLCVATDEAGGYEGGETGGDEFSAIFGG